MRWATFLTAGLAVAACGCGGNSYSVAPVSGRVTLNGQPLAGASVEFQPIGGKDRDPGPGSMATTDKDGRFTLKTQLPPSQPGAVVGKHQVRIYVYTEHTPDDTKDADAGGAKKKGPKGPVIPARYNSSSELTIDVPSAGLTDHHFDLKSP